MTAFKKNSTPPPPRKKKKNKTKKQTNKKTKTKQNKKIPPNFRVQSAPDCAEEMCLQVTGKCSHHP